MKSAGPVAAFDGTADTNMDSATLTNLSNLPLLPCFCYFGRLVWLPDHLMHEPTVLGNEVTVPYTAAARLCLYPPPTHNISASLRSSSPSDLSEQPCLILDPSH